MEWSEKVPQIEGRYVVVYYRGPAIADLSIRRDDEGDPFYYSVWIAEGTSGLRMESSVEEIKYWGARIPTIPTVD